MFITTELHPCLVLRVTLTNKCQKGIMMTLIETSNPCLCVYVYGYVRVSMRVCACVCVCARVRACVCMHACVSDRQSEGCGAPAAL